MGKENCSLKIIEKQEMELWPNGTVLVWHARGARFESPWGQHLCSPTSSEETINRGLNTPIPTTHVLICEELKDPGIPPKVVP